MVLAAILLAASTMGPASMRLGDALAAHQLPRDQAFVIVGLQVWAAFMAAFAFALATGELWFVRRLLADLALRPVSRLQAFLSLQAVSVAGRHALAVLSVGLPLLIIIGRWLDGVELAKAVGATFVLMRLPVALLTIGSRVVSGSIATLAGTAFGVMIAGGLLWLAAPGVVMAWSPPFLVVRILMEGASISAWAGLVAWTLALAAIEFLSMNLDEAPAAPRTRVARPFAEVPGIIRGLARLTRCSAVLLHGELLRLSRWRRFYLSWLMCAILMAMIGARESTDLVRLVLFALMPAHVGGSTLANMFATDRGAVQAFLMAPIRIGAVVHAKVISVLLWTAIAELAGVALLASRGYDAWPIATGVVLWAGLFAWASALGMMTSALFPSPSDPQTVGGSLVNTSAGAVIMIGNGLYVAAALGVAYLFDAGRWTPAISVVAGVFLLAAAATALVAAARATTPLITMRKEAMLAALTANPGIRA